MMNLFNMLKKSMKNGLEQVLIFSYIIDIRRNPKKEET